MVAEVTVHAGLPPSTAPASSAGGSPRRLAGKLRTGVNAGRSSNKSSSIPTRFETILHHDNHEADAFGRRTYRFNEPENLLPGPGAYDKSRSIVKQSATSVSIKGSSGFALPVGLKGHGPAKTPGPGTYTQDTFPTAATGAAASSPMKPSPVFVGPSPKPVLHIARPAAEPLGPGQYFTENNRSTLTAPCAAVMYHTTTKPRTSAFTKPIGVGPGQYETQGFRSVGVKDPMRASHFSMSGTSRFGPPKAHRDAVQRNLATNLPPLLASSYDVDRLGVPHVVREVQATRWSSRAQTTAAPTELRKPSSMFTETNLDRFGRPIIRYTAPPSDALGPGSYDLEEHPRRTLISSSWALSGTKREEPRDRYLPPGPAYYSPPPTATKVSHRVSDECSFVA